jgi:hypothetical protein
VIQSDHHERRFQDEHLGRKSQLWKRKPFAKEPAGTSVSITVFSVSCASDQRSGMVHNSGSAAYGADRESFDAMFMAHTDLDPDHDHDPP